MLAQSMSDGEPGERRKLPGVGASCDIQIYTLLNPVTIIANERAGPHISGPTVIIDLW